VNLSLGLRPVNSTGVRRNRRHPGKHRLRGSQGMLIKLSGAPKIQFTGRSPRTSSPFATPSPTRTCGGLATSRLRRKQFEALYADFLGHAEGMTLFAQDLYGGADPVLRIKTRVFTELAWHSLFNPPRC